MGGVRGDKWEILTVCWKTLCNTQKKQTNFSHIICYLDHVGKVILKPACRCSVAKDQEGVVIVAPFFFFYYLPVIIF